MGELARDAPAEVVSRKVEVCHVGRVFPFKRELTGQVVAAEVEIPEICHPADIRGECPGQVVAFQVEPGDATVLIGGHAEPG